VTGGIRPLCRLEENVILILLRFSETQSWRETFVERKWLSLDEELVQSLLELRSFKLLSFRLRTLFLKKKTNDKFETRA